MAAWVEGRVVGKREWTRSLVSLIRRGAGGQVRRGTVRAPRAAARRRVTRAHDRAAVLVRESAARIAPRVLLHHRRAGAAQPAAGGLEPRRPGLARAARQRLFLDIGRWLPPTCCGACRPAPASGRSCRCCAPTSRGARSRASCSCMPCVMPRSSRIATRSASDRAGARRSVHVHPDGEPRHRIRRRSRAAFPRRSTTDASRRAPASRCPRELACDAVRQSGDGGGHAEAARHARHAPASPARAGACDAGDVLVGRGTGARSEGRSHGSINERKGVQLRAGVACYGDAPSP